MDTKRNTKKHQTTKEEWKREIRDMIVGMSLMTCTVITFGFGTGLIIGGGTEVIGPRSGGITMLIISAPAMWHLIQGTGIAIKEMFKDTTKVKK